MKTLSIIAIAAALTISAPAVVFAQDTAPPQGDVRSEPAPPTSDEPQTRDEAPPSRDETAPPTRDETPPVDDSSTEPPADGGGDNGGGTGGGDEQEEQHRDLSIKDEMSCTVYPNWTVDADGTVHDFLDFENSGNSVLPKGTRVKFLLPDGSYYEWELDGPVVPGGTVGLTDVLPDQWPADWDCNATVKLPPASP